MAAPRSVRLLATMPPVRSSFRKGAETGSGYQPDRWASCRSTVRFCSLRWCGRGDSNPHRPKPYGFSYLPRLSPPPGGVWGLDYPFTMPRCRGLGAARLVSTPSRERAWLGITISQASPNLSSSTSRISPRALKSFKSGASTNFATPAHRRQHSLVRTRRQGCCGVYPQWSRTRLRDRPPGLADVDGGGVDHVLDVRRIVLLDHLDAGPAVFRDLVDVRALQQPMGDV